jgi:hypothetical protein
VLRLPYLNIIEFFAPFHNFFYFFLIFLLTRGSNCATLLSMKAKRKARTIQIPEWMDTAVNELAVKHKRSISGEIEFLIEEAIKNDTPLYTSRHPAPMGAALAGEAV